MSDHEEISQMNFFNALSAILSLSVSSCTTIVVSVDQGPMAKQGRDGHWWTDFVGSKKPCHQSLHLYCIQVGD